MISIEACWEQEWIELSLLILTTWGCPLITWRIWTCQLQKKEVFEAIRELSSDKAPGPDGLTGRFYKACWPTIKESVMQVLAAIWDRKFGHFSKLNSALVTLIPKKEGAD
jgi:hypothetical protein